MQPTPQVAPLSQLHQRLGQQQLPQQESSSQAHLQQQQQHATVNRQSAAALPQSQAVGTEANQPSPGRTNTAFNSVAAAAAALVTQPQVSAEFPQSSITCSDRPAEHLHSTATASDHPAPQQQSPSVTLRLPSDEQQASHSRQNRDMVRGGLSQQAPRQGGLSQGRFSQGAARPPPVGSLPQDGEGLSEQQLQQVSVPPQLPPQLHSLPHAQQPQHVSQAHAEAQSHIHSLTQSHNQAGEQSLLPAQSRGHAPPLQQQRQSHVPNPGVFGDEDDSSWAPDSPTPTLHYSPGPIGTCDQPADQAGSDRQHDQACELNTSSRVRIHVQI